MKRRKRVFAAVAAAALVAAGAAGAAGTGLLRITVGNGRHEAANGIVVHGRWTLVVHAKSGKVVARRHFENSLTTNGAQMLIGLLDPAGGVPIVAGIVGGLGVQLENGSQVAACSALYTYNPCILQRLWTRGADANGHGAGNLKVAVAGTTLNLTGSATPLVPVTLTKVETEVKQCDPWLGYDSEDCANQQVDNSDAASAGDTQWYPFTSRTLDTPLNVQAGQSVAVSVQISFS